MFSSNFPSNFKAADIVLINEKKDKPNIAKYRSISFLPNHYKNYENCMYYQMYKYFDQIYSKYQCGFRQVCNTQHCLPVIVKKWKEASDKDGLGGAILTDLFNNSHCNKGALMQI